MTKPNFENRTLFHGDNLPFLRAMNSETVDLIATDPPFNKGKDFHATPDSLASGAKFQDRWSWEGDVHQEWVDQITDDHPRLMEAIESARYAHSDGMGAYMCFMAVRLLEMCRVLKPTGSICVHCDSTASHYLKAVMDAIFGSKNFRNEIIWKRTSAHSQASKTLGRVDDRILFYTKSATYSFRPPRIPHSEGHLISKFKNKDERGRFFLENLTGPGKGTAPEWKGFTPPNGRSWAIPRKLVEECGGKEALKLTAIERLDLLYEAGLVVIPKRGFPRFKSYLNELEGKKAMSIWDDIPPVNSQAKERSGYPTQKPVALYERLIKVLSNEGDMVCDPFCGCATTLVAAEQSQRQWIGMDIWHGAYELVEERLSDESGLFGKVTFTDKLPERTDDGESSAPFLRVKESVKEPDGPRWTRAEMYEHLLKQKGPRCMGCDRTFDDSRYLELDHNTPRSDGGMNHISNRILLCSPCNRLKSNTYTLSGLRRQNRKLGYMSK